MFFCAECHGNEKSTIPARVLHNWDFSPRKVCKAAHEFLTAMAPQPVLCPSAVNPGLFATNKQLRHVRLLRLQLCRIRDFVETCRNRGRLLQLLAPRLYLIQNTELFSLTDLAEINSGELPKYLVAKIDHVSCLIYLPVYIYR